MIAQLNDLYLFAKVVEHKGFTAAGDVLGIPKSRISRRISKLEDQFGTRLLQRSSRKQSLTDTGQALYQHCLAMIEEAEAGEAAVKSRLSEPAGLVRISVPLAMSEWILANMLPTFLRRYPKVRLQLRADNRLVDLLEANIDVAVRNVNAATLPSSLIQMRLCTSPWSLVASPGLLAACGGIHDLAQLANQPLIVNAPSDESSSGIKLRDRNGNSHHVVGEIRLQADNIALLKQAALAGVGVAELPLYACQVELEKGSLVPMLPGWEPREGHLAVLYPSRRGVSPAVRACVDFFKNELPGALNAPAESNI